MRLHALSLALLCAALSAPAPSRAFGRGAPAPLRTRRPSARAAVRASDGEASLRAANLPTEVWQPPSREQQFERLTSEEFDLLVVGGGATGAGVAMDAASRGLRVALVEGSDYMSGTSSKSTKLIHGGLRYLAQAFQRKIPPRSLLDVFLNLRFDPEYLRIVAADLSERAWMIQSAPFMAKALPMMVPLYRWWEVPLFWVVGNMYDLIAGAGRGVPPSSIVSVEEARFQVPSLRSVDPDGNNLVGGLVVYDGQQNDARMGVHIILTAIQQGAACVNYASIESLLFADGKGAGDAGACVCGARVLDRRSGKSIDVKAKQVVNACGVFSDKVRQMAEPSLENMMVPSYGSHLTLPEYAGSARMGMVWFTNDGRVLYLLPWEGSTIAGTTDAPGELSYTPRTSASEAAFIIDEVNRVVSEPLSTDSVRSAWAGIRPLVRKPGSPPGDTKSLSRDHVVEKLNCGLVTVAGGKWTTYRKMAEDAVDKCVAENPALAHATRCRTLEMQLVGSDQTGEVCGGAFDRIVATLVDDVGVEKDVAKHLRSNYGTRALQIVALARAEPGRFCEVDRSRLQLGMRRLHPHFPHVEAEVAFACRHEFAQTPIDVLAQRTRLSFLDVTAARAALPRVMEIMALEKGWDAEQARDESERCETYLDSMLMPGAGRAVKHPGAEVLAA